MDKTKKSLYYLFTIALSKDPITDDEIDELSTIFFSTSKKERKNLEQRLKDYVDRYIATNSPYNVESETNLDVFEVNPITPEIVFNLNDIYDYLGQTYKVESLTAYLRGVVRYALREEQKKIQELKNQNPENPYVKLALAYAYNKIGYEMVIINLQRQTEIIDMQDTINEKEFDNGKISPAEYEKRKKEVTLYSQYIAASIYYTYLQSEQNDLYLKKGRKELQGIKLSDEEQIELKSYESMITWQQEEVNIQYAKYQVAIGELSDDDVQELIGESLLHQFKIETTTDEKTIEYTKHKVEGEYR